MSINGTLHTQSPSLTKLLTMRGWSLILVALLVNGKKISKKIDVEGLKLYQEPSGQVFLTKFDLWTFNFDRFWKIGKFRETLKSPVSESVQYKFKLSRRDRPEIQLLVNSKWIPLKITIDGKNEAVTLYSKPPRGKWQRRFGLNFSIFFVNFFINLPTR